MKNIMVFLIGFLITLSSYGQDTIMTEDFENVFPSSSWSTHMNFFTGLPPGYQRLAYWGTTNKVGYNSSHSGWCLGDGQQPVVYPSQVGYVDSWMIYGPFNLTGVGISISELKFQYDYHYYPETVKGYFVVRISTDTSTWNNPYPINDTINLSFTRTDWNDEPVWIEKTIDLSNFIGETEIFIAFQFYEEDGLYDMGGLVDNVSLTKYINVGFTENTKKDSISVYPNPSNGNFTIKNLTLNEPVTIYNIQGKLVYNSVVSNTEINFNLNVSPGVYLVRINNDTKKLIIQ